MFFILNWSEFGQKFTDTIVREYVWYQFKNARHNNNNKHKKNIILIPIRPGGFIPIPIQGLTLILIPIPKVKYTKYSYSKPRNLKMNILSSILCISINFFLHSSLPLQSSFP